MRQLYVQIHLNNFLIILYEHYNSNLSPPNVSSSHQMVDKRVGNWDGTSTFVQQEILQCSTIYDTSQQYKIRYLQFLREPCFELEDIDTYMPVARHCPTAFLDTTIDRMFVLSLSTTYLHSYLQYILTASMLATRYLIYYYSRHLLKMQSVKKT